MKKSIILTVIALMLSALTLSAGPAYPGRIVYTQPDGSTINIYLHGDEFGHWVSNEAGDILEQDADGYWRVASGLTRGSVGLLMQEASARRAAAAQVRQEYAQKAQSNNFGSPKIPVILVGFSDKAFSKTNAEFQAMLSQPGYSVNNAVGSVLDYYTENSFGVFTPQFEVLGPVQLSNNMANYGGNDSGGNDKLPEMALVHAAQQLDGSVDFSRYDNDGDGTVDFVIFYYAGYDEAQSGGSNCIWSHAWYLSSSSNARNSRTFDGVKLDRYFCTAELKGNTGSTMCSIGTTCHEFAHTLGLPDFYDADYSTNGSAASMYDFDLMASGSYNANSTTPPYLNSEEVYEIGWLQSIPEMTSTGAVTLQAVNYPGAASYSALMARTAVSGEYFVFETRGGQRWDAPLPTGMMVYHVDKSSNRVSGSITAASTWNNNSVNNYSSHPCCFVVPAANPARTAAYSGNAANFFFPGGMNVRTYSPTAWSGSAIGFQLANILYSNGVVTFDLVNSNTLGIIGTVTDTDGNPLSGATITISTDGNVVSPAPPKKSARGMKALLSDIRMLLKPSAKRKSAIHKSAVAYVYTDADGVYSLETDAGTYQVMASKDGYVSQVASVTVTSRIETQNFILMREGESLPDDIIAWPASLSDEDEYIVGASISAITAQNYYPATEMGMYAGKQIKTITFFLYGDQNTTYQGLNVIIDYDDERKATVPVSANDLTVGGYTTVDLRDQELIISSSKDIYAGVGYSNGGYSYNNAYYSFGAFYKTDDNDEFYDWAVGWPYDGLVSEFNLTSTGERYSWDLIFDFVLTVGDYEAPDTGFNYIADPQNGIYHPGDVFHLDLVETSGDKKPEGEIQWFYDDDPVTTGVVVLTSGTHVVEARFTTAEGKAKVVELSLSVGQ